ncbi:MAG: DnaJ C-terminal domain-containing protein [Patescibacteria group bacterium]|uniref:DnaJ domain-containing protein n=1 Tax=candidate division WWE3 bacterium TaxID=2053526 RepID=A0A955EBP2_UNCKA|nr:DnaJ domain-containing protein [candidate division WWE3 bacterium]
MAQEKNYYDILGVSKTASDSDIKSAYRKLAREHHPDMVAKEDKDAAEKRFKEINEAYQVLSDSDKRKMYDQFGSAGVNGHAGGGNYGGFGNQAGGQWGPFSYTYTSNASAAGFDPFDIFEDVFGFRGFGGQRAPRKGKNLYYEMHIDFEDAVKGVTKEVNVESGKVNVKIPAGMRDGTEMRFTGKGMPGPNNLPNGDLFITFRVRYPKQFRVVGDTVVVGLEIDFYDAILGANVDVPVVDPDSNDALGKVKIKIPSGTDHGTQIRLKGKGLPKMQSAGRGDAIVQVFVKLPKKVSRAQKKLLEEYKDL